MKINITNNNIKMALAELHEALVNLRNTATSPEAEEMEQFMATELYNEIVPWMNWFAAKTDELAPLEKVIADSNYIDAIQGKTTVC